MPPPENRFAILIWTECAEIVVLIAFELLSRPGTDPTSLPSFKPSGPFFPAGRLRSEGDSDVYDLLEDVHAHSHACDGSTGIIRQQAGIVTPIQLQPN